jgi:hypothetical protein
MKKLLLILLCLPMIGFGQTNCPVFGKIKIVDYGEDYSVKIVKYGGSYNVKYVDNLADKSGEWKLVEYSEDYKIKLVDYGEDFTIELKDYIKNSDYDISDVLSPIQSTAVIPNISTGIWAINKIIDNAIPFISFRYSKFSIWDWDRKNKNMSFSHRQEEVNIVHMYMDGNGISSFLIIETPRGLDKCYCSQIETSGNLTFECHWDFVGTMTEMWFGKESRADFKLVFRDVNTEKGELYLYYSPNLWGRYKKLKCLEDASSPIHLSKEQRRRLK